MVFPHMFRTEHTETKTTSSSYGAFYDRLHKIPRVPFEPEVVELLKYVDENCDRYVNDLRDAIAIKSISGSFEHRHEATRMITFTEQWLKKLHVKYDCYDVGWQRLDGLCCKLPTVILGTLGRCSTKKTLCIYGYLDVTSTKDQDWSTDPWILTEENKCLYGKGVVSGKGPLISWFHAIEAYQKLKLKIPVNIKFIIQSMNEQCDDSLETLLKAQRNKFLANIDYIVMCESEWLGSRHPCLVYGCTGTCRFELLVEKNNDSDPRKDMEEIFATIVDQDGRIIIPHFNDNVEQITPVEEKIYDTIDFNFEEIRPTLPANKQHWDKAQMLMSFWRLPDIVVGNIEECTCEKEDKTKLKRAFVFKIVPKQFPEHIAELVNSHIYNVCREMNCQSKVACEMVSCARPWLVDFLHPNYEAARRATVQIYKEEPNLIREDKEIASLLLLWRNIDRNILVLPLAHNSCNARSKNENITVRNYIEGTKVMIAYLNQLGYVQNE